MHDPARIIESVAKLLAAIAWPSTVLIAGYFFREPLSAVASRIPGLVDRVKKASIAKFELELERVANVEAESGAEKGNRVTPNQVEAATRIAIQARDVSTVELLSELDRLSMEYDALRRLAQPGPMRTGAMTRVLVKMRSLALIPSLVDFIDVYKGSGSPGSRLAAITMMQMVPRVADLGWLADRFKKEDQAFLLYHSALALQNVFDALPEQRSNITKVANDALAQVRSFQGGSPDKGTIEVLEVLLSTVPPQT